MADTAVIKPVCTVTVVCWVIRRFFSVDKEQLTPNNLINNIIRSGKACAFVPLTKIQDHTGKYPLIILTKLCTSDAVMITSAMAEDASHVTTAA